MKNKMILMMVAFFMSVTTLWAQTDKNINLDESEIKVVQLINNFRSQAKVEELKISQTLLNLASCQLEQMKNGNGELKHYFPNILVEELSDGEISFSVKKGNILSVKDEYGKELYSQSIFMGPASHIGVFLGLSYQKANILNKNFKYIGVKRVADVYVVVLSESADFKN